MQTNGLARTLRTLAQPIRRAASRVLTVLAGYFGLPYAGYTGWNYGTRMHYGNADPDASSIVVACIRWVQRTFTEAPPILEEWVEARKEWAQHLRHPVLDLLEKPNPYYNGSTLWKATIADWFLSGNAYWIKVYDTRGKLIELWWAPASTMEPKWDDKKNPGVFITHYEYTVPGQPPREIPDDDVVRFQDGIDPNNARKGVSALRSLLGEIYTDQEAAAMTSALLRNMGVPGVLISPKQGAPAISQPTAERLKAHFIAKTTGDKRGEPYVTEHGVEITQFGFSPEQMQLRSIRGIPEERITAVLGVNAAVVGLGAGLSTTKVGATLREYREEATESTIIPLYREIASEMTHQLLDEYKGKGWRLAFDLSKVRVLQDDENKKHERVIKDVLGGLIKVSEGRRALGYIALPEHEVYLRPRSVVAVAAGTSPQEQAAQSERTPAQGRLGAAVEADIREVLEGAQA
jgi:HK97 family phage portal protein